MKQVELRSIQSKIRIDDINKLRDVVEYIDSLLCINKITKEVQIDSIINLSKKISSVSYKKSSVKDRHRAVPWHNLEFLKQIFEAYKTNNTKDFVDFLIPLCDHALPLIWKIDLPELKSRLEMVINIEDEVDKNNASIRAIVSYPPVWGMENVMKLTGYFIDKLQLETTIFVADAMIKSEWTGTEKEKVALLRSIAIIGESTKYITPHTKSLDPSIPWKNLEKVRDLLSHLSRAPMRIAVQSILENKQINPFLRPGLDKFVKKKTIEELPRKAKISPEKTSHSKKLYWALSLFVAILSYVLGSWEIFLFILTCLTAIGMFILPKDDKNIYDLFKTGYLRGASFPPNLLSNIRRDEFPKLLKKLKSLSKRHNNSIYDTFPKMWFIIFTALTFSIQVSELLFLEEQFMSNIVLVAYLFIILVVMLIDSNIIFNKQKKSISRFWSKLPTPSKGDNIGMKLKMNAPKEQNNEMIEDLTKTLPEEIKENVMKYLRKELELTDKEKKAIFKFAQNREQREKWGKIMFNTSGTKEKRNATSTKEDRLKKYMEDHENSTLNREYGLQQIITFRKFLQNPAEYHIDAEKVCIMFALEEIKEIEILSKHIEEVSENYLLRFAMEFHLGNYSLYAAQIKWNFPKLLGIEHMEMRDHYMHGTEHSYINHLKDQGLQQIKKDIVYLLENIKPLLETCVNV